MQRRFGMLDRFEPRRDISAVESVRCVCVSLLDVRSIPSDILSPGAALSPSYIHAISNRNNTNEDLSSARPQIDEMSRTRTM